MEFDSYYVSDSEESKPMDPQLNERMCSKVIEDIQKKMYENTKTNIQHAHDRQKQQYDKHRCPTLFKCGGKVLCKNMMRNDRECGNFIERWKLPHTAFECLGKNTYKLSMVLHFRRMKISVT